MEEVGDVHAEDVSDPQQRRNAGVDEPGFDVLVGLASHAGGEEDVFLGAVLAESFDADAVADGASALVQPGVVFGELGHSSDTRRPMIVSQPGIPGFL